MTALVMVLIAARAVSGEHQHAAVEATGNSTCQGRALNLAYVTDVLPGAKDGQPKYVSHLWASDTNETTEATRSFESRALWSGDAAFDLQRHVQGRIRFLERGEAGWMAAATASPLAGYGQINIWTGTEDMRPRTNQHVNDGHSILPHVDLLKIRHVELENVHLAGSPSAHVASELDSPFLCERSRAICVFGTCGAIGGDPADATDPSASSRGIWCARLASTDDLRARVHEETLSARWIGPGCHPVVVQDPTRWVLAYWNGSGEELGLGPRSVHFLTSTDLHDWDKDGSLPDSLPVSERFEILGSPPSLSIVSEDLQGGDRLRQQRLEAGAWVEMPSVAIDGRFIRGDLPMIACPTSSRSARVTWFTIDGSATSVDVSY